MKHDILYNYVATARMLGVVDTAALFAAFDEETQRRDDIRAAMGRPRVDADIDMLQETLWMSPKKAAQALGISLSTFYRRKREAGI